jgi:hypothetical protein
MKTGRTHTPFIGQSHLMIGSGMVAGWNMDKNRAFRPWGLEAS